MQPAGEHGRMTMYNAFDRELQVAETYDGLVISVTIFETRDVNRLVAITYAQQ